ncbi:MAG: hypothetical protein MJ175_08660, partial [Clostridia bacterium]|nr:hypothetical protein [Clostridia bacterium]
MNIRGIWIWENDHPAKDEYADFLSDFTYKGGSCTLRISVDSDYAAYVNGTLCSFGQYADYPYYKVADEIDLTTFVRSGKNELMIIAWFNGAESCLTYHPGTAGVIYEVDGDGEVLAASSTDTLCRMNAHYISHRCKEITKQLSYGYAYDANGTELPLHKAVASAGHTTDLYKRPIASIELGEPVKETLLKAENGTHFLL